MNDRSLQPMLATLGKPPHRFAEFAVEAKYDGQRGMAAVSHGHVQLLSRNGADITRTFPEISSALARTRGRFVVDGEIVALDKSGVPSFSRLQRRWPQNRRPTAELLRQVPVRFYVFDILGLDDRDITGQPYAVRRARLTDLAAASRGSTIQFPANWTDTDPSVVLAASAELGLEVIVCKHLDSNTRRDYGHATGSRRRTASAASLSSAGGLPVSASTGTPSRRSLSEPMQTATWFSADV